METGKSATVEIKSRKKKHPTHYKKYAEKILQTEFWWKHTNKYLQEHHKQGTGFHGIQWTNTPMIFII